MPNRSKTRSRKQLSRPVVLLALLVVVVIAGIFLGLRLMGDSKNNDGTNTSNSTDTDTTPRPTTDKGQTQNPQPSQEDPNNPATANPENLPVTKPSGSFVSNHKPGQNSSPTEESSVCITTPGASCTINFTMNGTTKSLQSQVADSSGTVYWPSWTPDSVGLTPGNWTVTAVATWGTQTASTQDPVALQVSP